MPLAKKIIVIGGGIGGAATALALHRKGFYPVVYERVKELKEVGAGMPAFLTKSVIIKHRILTGSGFEASDRQRKSSTVCWSNFKLSSTLIRRR